MQPYISSYQRTYVYYSIITRKNNKNLIHPTTLEVGEFSVRKLKKKNEKMIEVCQKMIYYYEGIIRKNSDEIEKAEKEFFAIVQSHDIEGHETDCYKQIETPTFKIRYTKPKKDINTKDINIEEVPGKFIRKKIELDVRTLKGSTTIKDNNVIDNETGELLEFCKIYEKPGYYKMERKM